MVKKVIFVLTLCFALGERSSIAQTGPEVVEKREATAFASYTVIIPADGFEKEKLLQLASEYIKNYGGLEVLDVRIYTDRVRARDSSGKGIFHVTYSQWKREFENRHKGTSLRAAELLKNKAGATLRIRYSDGRIEEIAITGKNAFHQDVGGISLNLLQVTIVRQGFGTAKKWVPILFFSISKEVTAQQAGILAKSIFSSFVIPNTEVFLRQGEWFIFDPYYPWTNAFTPIEALPIEAEAARSAEFLCKLAEPQVCRQISSRGR